MADYSRHTDLDDPDGSQRSQRHSELDDGWPSSPTEQVEAELEPEEEEDEDAPPRSIGQRCDAWVRSEKRLWIARFTALRSWLRGLWIGQKLALQYLLADTRREKRGVAIGIFTVLLVVLLVALLQNNVSRSPLIFWRIAETTVGEGDLVLTNGYGVAGFQSATGERAAGGITDALVNQRYVDDQLKDLKGVAGSTGRWMFMVRVLAGNNSRPVGPLIPSFSANSSLPRSASAFVLGINSAKEEAMGLGRSWSHPPLHGQSAYLTRGVLREIGMVTDSDPSHVVGQNVILRLDLLQVAQTLNVGGTGGGADPNDATGNNTNGHAQSSEEQAAAMAREENNTPEQNQAILLRTLVQRGLPSMAKVWNQPLPLGNQTDLIIAIVDWFNRSLADSIPDASGFIPFPLPKPSGWKPGDPIPPEMGPILDFLEKRYGIVLTPTQLEAFIAAIIAGAQITPGGLIPPEAGAQLFDWSSLIFDASTIQDHLWRLKNGTETYGDLLDLFTPFLLQMLKMDTNFRVAGVVEEPDGKWSEALGSVVVLEEGELTLLLAASIQKVLQLQSRINTSAPLFPPIPAPSPSPVPVPEQASWPLERLIHFLFPGLNSTTLRQSLQVLDDASRSLRSANLSLMGMVQYEGRLGVYLKNLEDMNEDLMEFTNIVSAKGVGFDYPITYTLPLAAALKLTQYIRYFLDNIFGSVIFLLLLLGMLLIYSLLLNEVDAKTYEYGMLRALGMKHSTLVQILLSRSLMFSLPGIGLGLLLAFLGNIPLAHYLASFAHVDPEYSFFLAPLLVAICVGMVMPLVSNVIPISRALGKTLRDSLDVYHVVVSEVTVKVVKLQELGVDLWASALSILLIVVGFTVFYIVPYAFTFQLYPLFLAILNGVLLGMLLGLAVIAQLLQPALERGVVRLMLQGIVWPHRKLYSIVIKNLAAHRNRNEKTSQMFLICLSFLLFAGVMFNLQSAALSDNLKVYSGADILVMSPPRYPEKFHLQEERMKEVLNRAIAGREAGDKNQVVESYTFVSYGVNYLLPVNRVGFSTLPEFPVIRNIVWGVESNYLDVAYSEFFHASGVDTGSVGEGDVPRTREGQVDVVKMMVQDAGGVVLPEEREGQGRLPKDVSSVPAGIGVGRPVNETAAESRIAQSYTGYLDVLVSEALSGSHSVSLGTPLHLSVSSRTTDVDIHSDYLCKSRAMVIKLPGFFFSSYRQTAGMSSVVIGMEQYARVMRDVYGAWPTPRVPPKQKLLIRLTPGATRSQREDLINSLRTFFKGDQTRAIDTRSLIGTMDAAVALMNLFFTLVGAICMLMCFFILWLSFTANVQENSWEFGVLRAVGLNSVEVVCIYVYEALALVLASVLLGTCIGVLVAATLTLQFNLFTELPFRMDFPVPLFLSMVLMAIVVAIVGSALPAYNLLKKTISTVLRRQ